MLAGIADLGMEVPIKISIVTNAFNQGKYLEAAMTSVLSQDWPDVEYLVVDPGVQTALRYPKAAAIYADGYMSNAEGKIVARVISTRFSAKKFVYGGALVLQQSTFYRADAFRAVGGFNCENRTSWDAEILLDMALRDMSLVHVPGYWSVFRIHPESITGSQRMADESRKTHARYFQEVIGREKEPLDSVSAKLALGYTLLTEPRGLVARIRDFMGSPNINLSLCDSRDTRLPSQSGDK